MIYVNEGKEKKTFVEALRLVLLLLSLENTYVPGVPVERMHNALLLQTSHFHMYAKCLKITQNISFEVFHKKWTKLHLHILMLIFGTKIHTLAML